MDKKQSLQKLNMEEIGIPVESKIYANLNLSPSFKEIDFFCRNMRKQNMLVSVSASHSYIKIRLMNMHIRRITHLAELKELFPAYNFETKVN